MCGVFGFYLNRPLNESDIDRGHKAIAQLEHRGPDNTGVWLDENEGIFLAHTRLSIIDISSESNQPMHSENEVITFNGEIYNYREIKDSYNFQTATDSDTEVLLKAWSEDGEKSLEKLDGMFSFAIFNKSRKLLSLATDPFGEKPLYYLKNSEGFYFASEPGSLIDMLNLNVNLTEDDISAFLLLGFLPGTNTGFKNLNSAEPATLIKVSHDNYCVSKYWTPPQGEARKGKVEPLGEKNLDEITSCLLESLKVRLRADVPLGLFLSAGIDSSLIASLVKKDLNYDINSLTVSFPDEDVRDESLHAAKIAQYLAIPHEIVEGGKDPTRENHQLIYDIVGEVNSNTTVGAVFLISQAARKKFKVALCGLGGDELFFGYNKYKNLYQMNELSYRLKNKLKRALGNNKNLNFSRLNHMEQFLAIKHVHNYELLHQTLNFEVLKQYFNNNIKNSFMQARYFDLTQMMPHSYILGMERASMRVALELRTPFLNRKLYDLLSGFDARSFVHFGRKDVAKRILARYLPKELLDFPKNGFRSSVQNLFRNKPEIPVDNTLLDNFWNNRTGKHYEVIASRMVTLDHFINLQNS